MFQTPKSLLKRQEELKGYNFKVNEMKVIKLLNLNLLKMFRHVYFL